MITLSHEIAPQKFALSVWHCPKHDGSVVSSGVVPGAAVAACDAVVTGASVFSVIVGSAVVVTFGTAAVVTAGATVVGSAVEVSAVASAVTVVVVTAA